MLNIIDNYYIKKYKYGVILLKKLDNVNATQIELDTDYDDTVDEDNSVYDSKLFKRCGYYSDTYTAFIGLLSKIMNEKLENVKSIKEYVEVQKQYVAVLTRRYQQINNIKRIAMEVNCPMTKVRGL